MDRIPVAGPWITDREVEYAADAARNAWYSRAGEYPARFEQAMCDYLGVKYAVCVPHCTAAIHLSLVAMGVGPGDEVIVPDATWIASAAPITYVGATTVFADVNPETWCLDPASARKRITDKTKAIIAVDLYGSMPDLNGLRALCDEKGIALIEDSAEAIGSIYHGKKAGSLGDTGVFSFHGSKTLATGEGGMFVTSSEELRDRVLFLRDHGRPPGDRFFYNTEVAFKYRMSPVVAALGLAQLERIEELVGRKREIFAWYAEDLADVEGVSLNAEPEGTRNSYWMSTVVLDERYGLDKRKLMERFDTKGIDTRPFFHPLSSIPAYENTPDAARAREANTNSYTISNSGVNLPSPSNLTREQATRVTTALKEILAEASA